MTTAGLTHEDDIDLQTELRRAYLMVSFGHLDKAAGLCERLAEQRPDHPLPSILQGAILLTGGRINESVQHLSKAVRRFPDHPLGRIYFAEACLFAGRTRRGLKELDRAEAIDTDGSHADLIRTLREVWLELDPNRVPPPVVVPDDEA